MPGTGAALVDEQPLLAARRKLAQQLAHVVGQLSGECRTTLFLIPPDTVPEQSARSVSVIFCSTMGLLVSGRSMPIVVLRNAKVRTDGRIESMVAVHDLVGGGGGAQQCCQNRHQPCWP